jgi:hypothetical protein
LPLVARVIFAANAIRARSVLIESEAEAPDSCVDAFSSREPGSTSLENALAVRGGRDVDALLPCLTGVAAILSEYG